MRLGGILQAAIEVLSLTETGQKPVFEILKDWGKAHRFAGSQDRAFIGNVVYDALRKKSSFQYKMASNEPKALAYAAMLTLKNWDIKRLEEELENDKFAPEALNKAQKQAWQSNFLTNASDYIQADVPNWCVKSLELNLGQDWLQEGQALTERPPLDLRVNGLRTSRQKVEIQLKLSHPEPISLLPWGLRIAATKSAGRHPNLQADPAFQKGWFEIQDAGSQVAARLCQVKPGQQVLDYCAGGGGKTLALALDMQNRGQIHAFDAIKARIAPIFARIKRAGLRNVQVHTDIQALSGLENTMDCVLLDAPCSGTGTWRRHPDIKWRLTAENLAPRLIEQAKVLNNGAKYVKQGGRLVYVTCSLLYEENDAQIDQFLQAHPDFQKIDIEAHWLQNITSNDSIETEQVGAAHHKQEVPMPYFTKHGLALAPHKTGTDGFYVSILQKIS